MQLRFFSFLHPLKFKISNWDILIIPLWDNCVKGCGHEIERIAKKAWTLTTAAGDGVGNEPEFYQSLRERRARGRLPDTDSAGGLFQCINRLSP